MCGLKGRGGLGVKDLKNFNTVMLAKQGWRIMNNINPLVTEIMEARYFPHFEFLCASLGMNPSYVWRSIASAQDVLKIGCRVRIRNGESTSVWSSPGLPDHANGFMTTPMPVQLENITVASLMQTSDACWDSDVLSDICNERDVELIRRIPIPVERVRDSWFWIKDEKRHIHC